MALAVIGAGMGRTGTMSLKLALERLGFGPCYHGSEVVLRPADWPLWEQAIDGRLDDWEKIFANYRAAVDAPGWFFFRALSQYYPDAKVILTTRDANRWFESTQATVLSDGTGEVLKGAPKALFNIIHKIFLRGAGERMHDRGFMIDWFERHNAEVRRTISPERLLDYQVAQGWEPLCQFLGVPVPGEPFPRANEREAIANFAKTHPSRTDQFVQSRTSTDIREATLAQT